MEVCIPGEVDGVRLQVPYQPLAVVRCSAQPFIIICITTLAMLSVSFACMTGLLLVA